MGRSGASAVLLLKLETMLVLNIMEVAVPKIFAWENLEDLSGILITGCI